MGSLLDLLYLLYSYGVRVAEGVGQRLTDPIKEEELHREHSGGGTEGTEREAFWTGLQDGGG